LVPNKEILQNLQAGKKMNCPPFLKA